MGRQSTYQRNLALLLSVLLLLLLQLLIVAPSQAQTCGSDITFAVNTNTIIEREATVSFTNVDENVSIAVYVDRNNEGYGEAIPLRHGARSRTLANLDPDTPYRVKAHYSLPNNANCRITAPISFRTLAQRACGAGINFGIDTNKITDRSVTVVFSRVDSFSTSIDVYVDRTDDDEGYEHARSIPTTASHGRWEVSGLDPDAPYRIKAHYSLRGNPNCARSSPISFRTKTLDSIPASPTSLSTSGITVSSIRLNWSKSPGATSYEVRRDSGSWSDVGDVNNYTFGSLQPSQTYALQVRAKNSFGTSDAASVTARTLDAPPSRPTSLAASRTETSITLTWSAGSGGGPVDKFQVRRGSGSWVDAGSNNSHTFSALTAGTSYTLSVRAVGPGGTSAAASLTRSTRGQSPLPSQPDPDNDNDSNRNSGRGSDSDDNRNRDSDRDDDDANQPQEPVGSPAFNCNSAQKAQIVISPQPLFLHVQCVDQADIGRSELLPYGVVLGVDVWGWVQADFTVCFRQAGSLIFLDAAYSPRQIQAIASYAHNGLRCADVSRPGTVVLLNRPYLSASAPQTSGQTLTACFITTTDVLNFRSAPGGDRLGYVLPGQRFVAFERRMGYYRVMLVQRMGWISGTYVRTEGRCA